MSCVCSSSHSSGGHKRWHHQEQPLDGLDVLDVQAATDAAVDKLLGYSCQTHQLHHFKLG